MKKDILERDLRSHVKALEEERDWSVARMREASNSGYNEVSEFWQGNSLGIDLCINCLKALMLDHGIDLYE